MNSFYEYLFVNIILSIVLRSCSIGISPHFCSPQPTMNFSKHQFIQDCVGVGSTTSITGLYVRLEIRLSAADPTEKLKMDLISEYLSAIKSFQNGVPGALPRAPLLISTLLPFERKTTVAHVRLTRQEGFFEPVPSKGLVEMQCGFRR